MTEAYRVGNVPDATDIESLEFRFRALEPLSFACWPNRLSTEHFK